MRYTKDHLWIKYNKDTKEAECGISFHAQKDIGRVTKIELPTIGKEVHKNEVFGKVESVTSVLKLFSPVEFTVKEVS